jgi:hypothetical protein
MDAEKSTSVFRPTQGEDTHPHACTNGLVFLTYTVFDKEVGDEVERIEARPKEGRLERCRPLYLKRENPHLRASRCHRC